MCRVARVGWRRFVPEPLNFARVVLVCLAAFNICLAVFNICLAVFNIWMPERQRRLFWELEGEQKSLAAREADLKAAWSLIDKIADKLPPNRGGPTIPSDETRTWEFSLRLTEPIRQPFRNHPEPEVPVPDLPPLPKTEPCNFDLVYWACSFGTDLTTHPLKVGR
jgi:hypothetical protein